jgi:hypothetical protein
MSAPAASIRFEPWKHPTSALAEHAESSGRGFDALLAMRQAHRFRDDATSERPIAGSRPARAGHSGRMLAPPRYAGRSGYASAGHRDVFRSNAPMSRFSLFPAFAARAYILNSLLCWPSTGPMLNNKQGESCRGLPTKRRHTEAAISTIGQHDAIGGQTIKIERRSIRNSGVWLSAADGSDSSSRQFRSGCWSLGPQMNVAARRSR